MGTFVPMRYPFTVPVVGTSFRQADARTVEAGESALLRREPDNEHDPNAIAVMVGGRHVGYLPRALAARLDGITWSAVVSDVLRGEATGIRLRVTGPRAESDVDQPIIPQRVSSPSSPTLNRPPAQDILVRARSGRVLGMLLSRDDGRVKVLTSDGRTVMYPADLVETQRVALA